MKTLLIFSCYLLILTWASGKIITFLLSKTPVNTSRGLPTIGAKIGYVERILIFLFILLNRYDAIGFLLTAKSILRFSESRSDKEYAEYVLYGTLLSVLCALVIGLIAKHFYCPSLCTST